METEVFYPVSTGCGMAGPGLNRIVFICAVLPQWMKCLALCWWIIFDFDGAPREQLGLARCNLLGDLDPEMEEGLIGQCRLVRATPNGFLHLTPCPQLACAGQAYIGRPTP